MDIFGAQFNTTTIAAAVNWTNVYYGGWNISTSVTNIVFPNGSIDPWHALGITTSLSEALVAIFIHGTAHCANMYPAAADDPMELVNARTAITASIQKVHLCVPIHWACYCTNCTKALQVLAY